MWQLANDHNANSSDRIMVSYADGIGCIGTAGYLLAPLDFSQGVPSQVRWGFGYVNAIHAIINMDKNRRSESESLICLKIHAILTEVENPCCAAALLIEIKPFHGAFASMALFYSLFCLSAHCVPLP
jgi:hypothetical protein